MQEDAHYYGTYSIARSAGLKPQDARVIAYSAQFVDHSTHTDDKEHKDGGLIYTVATAHHAPQAVYDTALYGTKGQRRMWVPFHFYPGNEGDSLSKKMICQKDSLLVNEMFDNHMNRIKENLPYILHLIGIASHVYMDTFSHYGFSGLSSRNNKVDQSTFKFPEDKIEEIKKHHKKFKKKNGKEFYRKNWRESVSKQGFFGWFAEKFPKIAGWLSSKTTGALGHGSVATCPDLPFLKWSFTYKESKEFSGNRDNPKTFLEGYEKLHKKLIRVSKTYYKNETLQYRDFSEIEKTIREILSYRSSVEKGHNERIIKWKKAVESGRLFDVSPNQKEFLNYDEKDWRLQKDELFKKLKCSAKATELDVYKFHQAADYHRHYTIKQLLPKYGIVIN